MLISKFEDVDISQVTVKKMFDSRLKLSSPKDEFDSVRKHDIVGQVYEQRIRMDEIKQFAKNVVPKSRFLFDSYKVQTWS